MKKNIDKIEFWVPAKESTAFELLYLISFNSFETYYQAELERFITKLLKFYSIILNVSYSDMLSLFEEQNRNYKKVLQDTYAENDTLSIFAKKFNRLVLALRLPAIDTITITMEDIKKFKELL